MKRRLITFGRGKDKKKRKRRGLLQDASVTTGLAAGGAALAYKGSMRQDMAKTKRRLSENYDDVINEARNKTQNKGLSDELGDYENRLNKSNEARSRMESLDRRLTEDGVSPKMAEKAKARMASKYSAAINDNADDLAKNISGVKNKLASSEVAGSINKKKAAKLALAGAAVGAGGGYLASRMIRRRMENRK